MRTVESFSILAFLVTISSGVQIQCEYKIFHENLGKTSEKVYECQGTVTSTENPTIVTEISGNHLAGKSNADVKSFTVSFQESLNIIPKGVENFFANIEKFLWYGGSIATIESSTFKPFPNLSSIFLSGNKLVTLDGDLFRNTRKLREISFSSNKLEHVGHDLLTGLTDLIFANFESNPCINMYSKTPEELQKLNHQLTIKCSPSPTTSEPNQTGRSH